MPAPVQLLTVQLPSVMPASVQLLPVQLQSVMLFPDLHLPPRRLLRTALFVAAEVSGAA